MGDDDDAQHNLQLITCQPRYIFARKKKSEFKKKYKNAILMGKYYLGDANTSARNVEFGSQNPSFGNRRSAVGKRIPSTRLIVTRPAQV